MAGIAHQNDLKQKNFAKGSQSANKTLIVGGREKCCGGPGRGREKGIG